MHFVKHFGLPVILPLPLTTLSVIFELVPPLVANSYSSPTRPSLGYHKGIKSMASNIQTSPPLPSSEYQPQTQPPQKLLHSSPITVSKNAKTQNLWTKKIQKYKNKLYMSTPAGFEPALTNETDVGFLSFRAKEMRIRVCRLNHSAKVSLLG